MAKKQKKKISRKDKKWREKIKKAKEAKTTASIDTIIQETLRLYREGKKKDAQQAFQDLLDTGYQDPVILNKLGYLAHSIGNSAMALQLLRESAEKLPSAPFYNNLGLIQEQSGLLEDAGESYKIALKFDPEFAPVHYNLGNILLYNSQLENAIEHYRLAVYYKPDYAAAYNNLANAQEKIGAFDEAIDSCIQALRIDPEIITAVRTWCNIKLHNNEPEKVLKACEEELEFIRKKTYLYIELGNSFSSLGMKREALKAYQNAFTTGKKPGTIYYCLSRTKKFDITDPDIIEMEKVYSACTDPEDRKFICFGLGKVYEDAGDYQKAFKYIAEGNRLVRETYSYSIDEEKNLFSALKSIYTTQHLRQFKNVGRNDATPVFVVGMPRSGTTLVEQILSSHSGVYAAGELSEMKRLIKNTVLHENGKQIPDGLAELGPDSLREIGDKYISFIRRFDKNALRIVDKMPQNFQLLGIIHLALPEAKIIHCKRDPVDTCWSIYKNIFHVPHKYAQDLIELGEYYGLYADLMEHWKQVLGGNILELEYEEIIRDQENNTRKLLEFCNLPWEENCLQFHKAERKVKTASLWQVRQPIYSSSVRKWKNFENQLQPLTEILLDRK